MCDVTLVSVLYFIPDDNEATLDTSAAQKRTLTIMPSIGMFQEQTSDLRTPKQNTPTNTPKHFGDNGLKTWCFSYKNKGILFCGVEEM